MCLVVFSLRQHPRYPFVFAGNRDEFFARPAEPVHFWDDHFLAGRDLKAGGTWLGVTRDGRFATVTNFREPGEHRPDARSRGDLVTDYLRGYAPADRFLDELNPAEYNGFNLLMGRWDAFYYLSNEADARQTLEAGLYGLSNGRLDTPWPKVRRARSRLQHLIRDDEVQPEALLQLLLDDERAPLTELPRTGIGDKWESMLSSIFVRGREYGTRASMVVIIDHEGTLRFVERTFGRDGREAGTESFKFNIEPASHG